MPASPQLTELALRHALAMTQASTPAELSARGKDAAVEVSATAAEPEPVLALLAAHEAACRERLGTVAALQEQASADPLTGLPHHRLLAARLAATAGGYAVLAIDVDWFKAVNDTHGHQAGDRALVDLVEALQAELPAGDELYRVGGDEFVALVEIFSSGQAEALARRLCRAARRVGRTISVGVAMLAAGDSAEAGLRRADAALYEAKRAGRDTVHLNS